LANAVFVYSGPPAKELRLRRLVYENIDYYMGHTSVNLESEQAINGYSLSVVPYAATK